MVSADAVLQNTYEFKNKNGKSMKEDVSADVKSNYVQYHLKDDDGEVWVIDDFNRVSRDFRTVLSNQMQSHFVHCRQGP